MNTLLRTVAALAAVVTSAAMAQSYPSEPITLVVPFAAGSGTDGVARILAKRLSERLKQAVIIDNRAGGSAQIGAVFVAKAKPDGYTLFMTTNTSHSANPSLFKSLKYDPIKDFTPITRVGELPFALLVRPEFPAQNVDGLIAYAKAHPAALSYATPNSTSLVASETIKRIAGIQATEVRYKSSPQALTDLMGDAVQFYVADLGSSVNMIRSGKVRAIGVTTKEPLASMPNVPPIAKQLPGFDLTSWNGVFGPAGMPKPVVDKLNGELLQILAEKEVKTQLGQLGFEVWPSKSPEEFKAYVAEQLAHWTSMIKQAGIPAE